MNARPSKLLGIVLAVTKGSFIPMSSDSGSECSMGAWTGGARAAKGETTAVNSLLGDPTRTGGPGTEENGGIQTNQA